MIHHDSAFGQMRQGLQGDVTHIVVVADAQNQQLDPGRSVSSRLGVSAAGRLGQDFALAGDRLKPATACPA